MFDKGLAGLRWCLVTTYFLLGFPMGFLLGPPLEAADRQEGAEGKSDRPPNVVLIISDDQAWTDYGFMGHPQIQTPRLDQLARESLVYPRGYVPSSLCCPSLASIVTGLYPHQNKITSNDPRRPAGLPFGKALGDAGFQARCKQMDEFIERVPTVPRLLAQHGTLSHQSGKWWHGSYRLGGFTHGMTHGDPKRGGRHGDAGLTIGRQGLEPIVQFLEYAAEEQKPFFLWYAPFLPHRPHNPPARLLEKYKDKTDSLPIAKYWAMCEWFDETCGQLLDLLATQERGENTMVLYVCDNGWIQQPDAGGYAPRSKRSPYDGGLRTPIMVHWPGHVRPRRCEQVVSSLDLAPTILTAYGLQPTHAMQGLNLLDVHAIAARQRIYGEVFTHDAADLDRPEASLKYRWCIAGPWKLIVPQRANVPDGRVELFHLEDDPREEKNLADQRPDLVESLRQGIDEQWHVKN